MNRRFWAFTLAETLIVMGIIGVVAALTVPNLNASTGEKEKIAKVKKIYKDLNDAYGRAVAVYGPVDEWFAKDTTAAAQSTRFGERMLDFMKVSKNCKTATGCFKSSSDSGADFQRKAVYNYSFITTDGTSIGIKVPGILVDGVASIASIYIDIDGPTKGADRG